MKIILQWYAGMAARILGYAWDVFAGWACTDCGWRNPNQVLVCQECDVGRFTERE
jgi:hypothetical protein